MSIISKLSKGSHEIGRTALVLFGLLLASTAAAQTSGESRPDSIDGSELRVSLVTVGPGSVVWERFGHNALWIRNESGDLNRAYNYGLFSFEQEGFLARFLQGRMEYWMRGFDADPHLQSYISYNRSVWIQELSLTDPEKVELLEFLEWNERPEHRFYRYHYYHDNCSTRIRDAIDRVLGGAIRDHTEREYPGHTLRFHSLRLVSHDIFTYAGLLLGLGQPVDEPLSAWDEMFLPLKLREHLRDVVIVGEDGVERNLVASERTLFESTELVERTELPSWTFKFLAAGLVLAFIALALAHRAINGKLARAGFTVYAMIWYTITGIAGFVLAGLWMFTDHDTSYRNENLFLFTPVAILLVALVPLAVRRIAWAGRFGRLAAVFVAGLAFLGLVMQIVPGMDQVNGQLYALALPPHIAFAAGLIWFSSMED